MNPLATLWLILAGGILLNLFVIAAACAFFFDPTPANLIGLCAMLAVLSLASVWLLVRAKQHDQ